MIRLLMASGFLLASVQGQVLPGDSEAAYQIFVGRVERVNIVNSKKMENSRWTGYFVAFRVEKVLKGKVDPNYDFFIHYLEKYGLKGIYHSFPIGRRYKIYLMRAPRLAGKDWAGILSPSQKIHQHPDCCRFSPE